MREVLRGLLTSNFRRWGPTQYRQYWTMFGHSQRCGIELEAKVPLFNSVEEHNKEWARYQGKYPWREINQNGWKYTRRENVGEIEVIRLFDVTEPKLFVRELQLAWEYITSPSLRLNVLGSVHLNHQARQKHHGIEMGGYYWRPDVQLDTDDPLRVIEGIYRVENKRGIGSYQWEDILLQMIYSYCNFNWIFIREQGSEYMGENQLLELRHLIAEVYPKNRRLMSVLNFEVLSSNIPVKEKGTHVLMYHR